MNNFLIQVSTVSTDFTFFILKHGIEDNLDCCKCNIDDVYNILIFKTKKCNILIDNIYHILF